MVGNGTDFLSQKDRNWRDRELNIDSISLQLLDALGKELVVVNQWPQVSVHFEKSRVRSRWNITSTFFHVHRADTYLHRLLCDVGSIQGFFPDLASHQLRLGFHSCVRVLPANVEP